MICDEEGIPRLIQSVRHFGDLTYSVEFFNNTGIVIDDSVVGFIDAGISKDLTSEITYNRLTEHFTKYWREYNG